MHRPPPSFRRLPVLLALVAVLLGVGAIPAAHAADRGTGFGTWAPLSRTGWHGSMLVGDVHTYCIHPGLPVATGTTTDNGESSDVAGLSPQQLASINHLVTTYGQTGDAVQAASVSWAVKAIADRETTLHSWGYTGDDMREAIDYIMRRASPENSSAIQDRTMQYLAEAEAITVPRSGGSLTLSTTEGQPTQGTLTVDVDATTTGMLRLENAVFADTGSAERTDVHGGETYAIIAPASASDDGRPYTVRARGEFTARSASVRSYSTPGQQETAGPARPITFELTAEDASPRVVQFSPRIETLARIDADDRFVDEVTLSTTEGVWPRHSDGSFVVITATADLYRTNAFPAESAEIPSNLVPVARLDLRTDPDKGAGVYEVATDTLPGPGVYTAVWRIDRDSQDAETLPHLPSTYSYRERFANPDQTEQLAHTPPPAVPAPSPTPTPVPAVIPPAPTAPPAALASTGISTASLGGAAGASVVVIGLGLLAWRTVRRRRTASITS